MMARRGYGLPLRCPRCPDKHYYGLLKTPGVRATPCPNCGATLVACHKYQPEVRKGGEDGRPVGIGA